MDPKTITELSKLDKTMGKLIKKVGPMELKPKKGKNPYQSLVEAVVYQQLTGKAAATILGRVLDIFPDAKFPTPEQILKIKDERFRSAGLSGAKTAAIKDISAKALDGTIPDNRSIVKLGDQEIIDRLTTIRGVGPWTVEMMLIFKLGRPDIMPSTDYGVRKGFALTYGWDELPSPKELLLIAEKWRPYRTTAAWYLWRSLDKPTK